jgi:hypothetical protein
MKRKNPPLFFLSIAILGLSMTTALWAKDITLELEASDDPDIAGHRIYYKVGTPHGILDGTGAAEGPSPIDIGPSLTATISGLDGHIVFLAVSSYDKWGNESPLSEVIASHWIPVGYSPGNRKLLSPQQINFRWEAPPADAHIVSYKLIYTSDPTLLDGALAQAPHRTALLAGMSLLWLAGMGRFAGRRMARLIPVAAAWAIFLMSGCGGGDEWLDRAFQGDAQVVTDLSTNSYTAYGLEPSITYYWQVVAIDNSGVELESAVYTFTTGAM